MPIDNFTDSSVLYGMAGPITLPTDLSDYRIIKLEVTPSSFRYYIDGTFITEFPHATFSKFQGYDFHPYAGSFRVDWMKITDDNGQVIMFEDFDKGCGNLAQITKDRANPIVKLHLLNTIIKLNLLIILLVKLIVFT
jgi:hypothetical protein